MKSSLLALALCLLVQEGKAEKDFKQALALSSGRELEKACRQLVV